MNQSMHPRVAIAFFISPHGFGHASRAAAVINAIAAKWPFVHVHLFTTIPAWFFEDTLCAAFSYHEFAADIGTVQRSPLTVDLEATIARLDETYPMADPELDALADRLHALECRLVASDISPWGIAAAKRAGLPSILIENFTWDWIYEAYASHAPQLNPHIRYLNDIFADADHRIQAIPFCARHSNADLQIPPASRKPAASRADIRNRLGLNENRRMVLITMGGIPDTPRFLPMLAEFGQDHLFVVPGDYPELPTEGERCGNLLRLPHRSAFYHPDLINAADAVVGKTGYSTLAEVYQAGVPFGYVARPNFRESDVLEDFIHSEMGGMPIARAAFETGEFLKNLPGLLDLPKKEPNSQNGADAAADYICRLLACRHELLEVVDRQGRICGAAPRCEVHGNRDWLHQVVHVLVFDDSGRLLLQKRSFQKTVAAGKWDTSVGGHVDCGESIESAMQREMAEELGIHGAAPQFAYQYIHSNDFESELVHTYICRCNGGIRFNPDEIDSVAFWAPSEISANLGKGIFSDNFEHEFALYRKWAGRDG
jgi:isopentenyldiphosphate isomerase